METKPLLGLGPDGLALPPTFCHKAYIAKGRRKPLVTHRDEGLFVTAAESGLS